MTLVPFPSPFGKPAMGAAAPLDVPPHPGDWSQQELADLYRVEALLTQANMRVETDRGTTDEGEPWFVFCRPDGEIFVHLCRIGGEYLLDSPGLDAPLRGSDFAGLIDQFVRSVAARAATGNVVQLRKARHDNVVRLHPAIMMAALIWSLYLASDHLMEAAHAAEFDLEGGGDSSALSALDSDASVEALAANLDAQLGSDHNNTDERGVAGTEVGRSAAGGERGSFSGAAAASLAATLTAIAVTYGLIEQRQIELDLARGSLGGMGAPGAADPGAAALEMVVADAYDYDSTTPIILGHPDGPVMADALPGTDLAEVVADTLALTLNNLAAVADRVPAMLTALRADRPAAVEAQQAAEITHVPAMLVAKPKAAEPLVSGEERKEGAILLTSSENHSGAPAVDAVDSLVIPASFELSSGQPAVDQPVATEAADPAPSKNPLLAKFETLLMEHSELVIGDAGLGFDGDQPIVARTNSGWEAFNNDALISLTGYFESSNTGLDTIEIKLINNHILVMDVSAFDVGDHLHTKTWSAGGDLVITIAGHAEQLSDLGLVLV